MTNRKMQSSDDVESRDREGADRGAAGSRDRQGADGAVIPPSDAPDPITLANARGSNTQAVRSSKLDLYPDDVPLAYLITFTTYGSWLHGDERGSVDLAHHQHGAPVLAADPAREQEERKRMMQPAYELDAPRRSIVLHTIREVCAHRGWPLLAAHVRAKHVHTVVQAFADCDKVMNDFKSNSSRKLNEAGFDHGDRKRWTRHGSTRKLWTQAAVEAAIHYVVYQQGEPTAVLHDPGAIVRITAELEAAVRVGPANDAPRGAKGI